MKSITRQLKVLAILAICLSMLAVHPGQVLALSTSVSFGSLPSTQPGWSYADDPLPHLSTPEATYFSIVGNALHMDTRGRNGDGAYGYQYLPAALDPNLPFTLTFVARTTGNSRWSPAGLTAFVSFPDKTFDIEVAMGPNTIVAGAGAHIFSTSIDASQYHEYRLEGIPSGQFELFVDNVSLGVGEATTQPSSPKLYFGDGTRGGDAVADIIGLSFAQGDAVIGSDPALSGCYLYTPNAVNEGDSFAATVKCHDIGSPVYGFQFGTTFSPALVTRNGVPNTPVATQLGTSYVEGNFAPTNPLVGMNSLSNLYAVSHTGTDTSTGDFTLGTFYATAPLGITANSSATVDLRDLKLSDISGADVVVGLPNSQTTVTINNLYIALRGSGTIRVSSDGRMTTLRAVHLGLDGGDPADIPTASGSFTDFSVLAYRYPTGKQSADLAISLTSHLSCTRTVPLVDGLNTVSALGTAYTLKAGDANADHHIDLNDAVLVGSYFGTSRTDGTDINGDGTINIFDLVHIGRNYTAVSGTCS